MSEYRELPSDRAFTEFLASRSKWRVKAEAPRGMRRGQDLAEYDAETDRLRRFIAGLHRVRAGYLIGKVI